MLVSYNLICPPSMAQGEPGEYFFVVKGGTFALKVSQVSGEGSADVQTVHRYASDSGPDSCFGEIALVSGSKPYGGSIIARSAGAAISLIFCNVNGAHLSVHHLKCSKTYRIFSPFTTFTHSSLHACTHACA